MNVLTESTNRRDALQQLLALTLSTSLLGLSSCSDEKTAEPLSQAATTNKTVIPCKPLSIPPPELPLEAPAGLNIRIRVRSTQTSNQFGCAEVLVLPKTMGPAPHYHKELDEVMFVQKGTASVMVGDEVYEVKAGGWHIRPRNIPHTFWNGQEEPLHFFDMFFNQNFEDFLEELSQKIIPEMMQKKIARNDPEYVKRLSELYSKFDIVAFPEQRQPIIDKYGLKG
jgi:mannose-6-phosphate isomerase-like protein (cupin superfamily)